MKLVKPDIRKLKYPLWLSIIFYMLTVLIPITTLMIQSFKSPNKVFKITFSIFAVGVILWIFIKKFIIVNVETKLKNEKVALEHDYMTENGNLTKIKWLWYSNELYLTLISSVSVMLIGSLLMLIMTAVANGVVKIKGASLFVATIYVLAYFIKFVYIIVARNNDPDYKAKEAK